MSAVNYAWSQRATKLRQYGVLFTGKVKSFLTLPGGECADVRYGIKQGFLAGASITCAEREKSLCPAIESYLATLPNDSYLHQGRLEDLTLDRKYDCIFMDLFGGLTVPVANWCRRYLSLHCTANAGFTLVVDEKWRNNEIMPVCLPILEDHEPEFLDSCRLASNLSNFGRDFLACNLWTLQYFCFPERALKFVEAVETREDKGHTMLCLRVQVRASVERHMSKAARAMVENFPLLHA